LRGSTKRYLLVSLHSFIKNSLQSLRETGKHYKQAAAIAKNEEEYFAIWSRSRSGVCNVTV